jgi:hypothetical protein
MQQDFGGIPQARARVDALRAEPEHYGPPGQPAMPTPPEGGSYYGAGGGSASGGASPGGGSFYPPDVQGEASTDLPHGIIGMTDSDIRDDETGQMYRTTGGDWEIGPEGVTGSMADEIRNPEAERAAMIRRVLESIKGPQFGRR